MNHAAFAMTAPAFVMTSRAFAMFGDVRTNMVHVKELFFDSASAACATL
jgi:hypothetical protein